MAVRESNNPYRKHSYEWSQREAAIDNKFWEDRRREQAMLASHEKFIASRLARLRKTSRKSSGGGGMDLFSGRVCQLYLFIACLILSVLLGAATESWLVGILSGVLLLGGTAWLNEILDGHVGEIVDNIIVGTVVGSVGTFFYLKVFTDVNVSWQRFLAIGGTWAVVLTIGYLIYRRLMRKPKFARAVHIFSEGCRYSLFIGIAGFIAYKLHIHGVF